MKGVKMRKRKIRSLITCFLILMMVVSFIPEASAGEITNLSKTVSSTPNENGELDITLTVSGTTITKDQPLNLLLVIDLSNSMKWNLSGTNQNPAAGSSRLGILKRALAGEGTNFIDSLAARVGEGNLNVDIVTFGSTAANALDWTNDLTAVKSTINELTANGGTNYQDALAKAQQAASDKSDVHVIFLSDGLPTFYGADGIRSNGTTCSVTNLEQTLSQMQSYQNDANITFRAAIAYATTPTFTTDRERDGNTNYRYANVSLMGPAKSNVTGTCQTGRGNNWTDGPSENNLENRQIHTIGYDAYQTANNETELLNSLNAIVKGFNLSSVTITDPMHQTYISEQIDLSSLHTEGKLRVYLVSEDGTETQLSYEEDYTVTGDTINYLPDLAAGDTLKIVATVKVSDSPGAIYFENQACPDADADGNQGFFSNETASASGTVDQESYTGSYLNPVFRLNTTSLTLKKVNAADETQVLEGATFTLTRNPYDDMSGSSVTRTETYTTGEDGTVRIPNLPYGDYELTETVSPDGFQLLDSPLTFSVDYLGHMTSSDIRLESLTADSTDGYTATVTNVPSLVTLTVTKTLEGTAKNTSDTFPFILSATEYPNYVTDAEKVTDVSESIGQNGSLAITVPCGTTVKVQEADSQGYTALVNRTEGQEEVLTDWTKDENGFSGTITLTKNTEITITNTKNAPVVTGFITDTSGTAGIALVSVTLIGLGAVLVYLKKRHF